jgi:hypothetical protein
MSWAWKPSISGGKHGRRFGCSIAMYSAWGLAHDDPCWEGHVHYAVDAGQPGDRLIAQGLLEAPEVFTVAKLIRPTTLFETRHR